MPLEDGSDDFCGLNRDVLIFDVVFIFQDLHDRVIDLWRHWSIEAWAWEGTLQDLQDSNGTRNTDQLGHRGVAARNTIVDQGRGSSLGFAVRPLDAELVLQNDHVSLALFVLHQLLKSGAQGVQWVAGRSDFLVGEQTEPLETSQNSLSVGLVLELGQRVNLGNNVLLRRRGSSNVLGNSLIPWNGLGENFVWILFQESHVHKNLDELWESLESQSASDNGLGLRNVVELLVNSGVSVRVADQRVSRIDEVWLGRGHQVFGSNLLDLAIFPVCGLISQSKKNTSRGPRELVSQRIVRIFWCWKTTTVRQERGDLTTGLVDLVDGLDGVQVVDTWVQADLVHHDNAGLLDGWLQLSQSRRDVGGGDDVGVLRLDCSPDDGSVVDVWNQRDDNIVLIDLSVQSILVSNVQRQCVGNRACQFLGFRESSACDSNFDVFLLSEDVDSWLGDETRTEKEHFLSHVGRKI
ncbi:hypothetical protein OGATHE_003137 [Ogataea polymorpha]|uniref:Uncharacterized protein n=1 Tax=Ogataea polymorpha TaxID=460523 RepID=A0A9P8P9X8_9ASCO|nr:hypothetical protein OGATHE_003137 [Ogataea polymorpha]